DDEHFVFRAAQAVRTLVVLDPAKDLPRKFSFGYGTGDMGAERNRLFADGIVVNVLGRKSLLAFVEVHKIGVLRTRELVVANDQFRLFVAELDKYLVGYLQLRRGTVGLEGDVVVGG